MVNRVFIYSEDVAKNNKNTFSLKKMVLEIFFLIFLFVILLFLIGGVLLDYIAVYIIIFIIWISVIIFYCVLTAEKLRARLKGFAIDDNNNIYCAKKLNNGEEFVLGGMALNNILDNISTDGNSILGDISQVAGAAMTLYSLNNSIKIMQNPVVVSKMVECKENLTGGVVWKILKVNNIIEDQRKYIVYCDYQIMRNKKIKYNKKLIIYKIYNSHADLKEILEGKR